MAAQTQKSNRVDWIDFIKGVAITLVVYGHVMQGAVAGGTVPASRFYEGSDVFIYSFHMAAFFVVSGLLSHKLWSAPLGKYLVDKLRTIAWPYAIWFAIGTVSLFVFARFYNHPPGSNVFLALACLVWDPGSFWFLHALFFVHVVAALLRNIPKLLLALVSILGFWLSEYSANVAVHNVLYYLPFFVLGFLASGQMTRMDSFLKHWAVLGFLVTLTLQLAGTLLLSEVFWPIKLILGLCGTAMLGFLGMAVSPSALASVVCRVGAASLGVFLMHPFAQGVVRILLLKGLRLHNPIALVLLQTILATAIPVILHEKAMATRLRLLFTLKAPPPLRPSFECQERLSIQ